MSTHDWMKSEYPAHQGPAKTAPRRPLSVLELVLMAAGGLYARLARLQFEAA